MTVLTVLIPNPKYLAHYWFIFLLLQLEHKLHGGYYYFPHFTDEETVAQRGEVNCSVARSLEVAEPRFEPGKPDFMLLNH